MIELAEPIEAVDAGHVRLSTVTAEARGPLLDRSVSAILQILREQLALEVVFVSEFVDGRRIYRHVDAAPHRQVIAVGDAAPLEDTLCTRIVDGRLEPFTSNVEAVRIRQALPAVARGVGTYLGVPVRLGNGKVFGALCGFSFHTHHELDEREVARLEMAAGVIARVLEGAEGEGVVPTA